MSVPAIFNQVAKDRLSTCQFTQPTPNFLAAGLMCRTKMLLSRIGKPLTGDWNTRSSGPADFTAGYLRTARP